MNKQEIQKQIDILKANHARDIAELEAKLKEPEKWSPKNGDWYIDSSGDIYDLDITKGTRLIGIEHTSKENAQKHAKFQKLQNWLYQLALELNEGWEPDWGNNNQTKWYVYCDYSSYVCLLSGCARGVEYLGVSYFKDKETANKAIEIINNWSLEDE